MHAARSGGNFPQRSRFYIAAFGDPGHAFVAIALGRALTERGHEVRVQTWSGWRDQVEAEGMSFDQALEYPVFFTPQRPVRPYEAVGDAARLTRGQIARFDPDCVVADVLTVGAALAAEGEQRPWVSLVPHVLPTAAPGVPPYATGARLPRTPVGRTLWRALDPLLKAGLRRGRRELNAVRQSLELDPTRELYGAISRDLVLVATFPQLEYPRQAWDRSVEITGPLLWQQPYEAEIELPPGSQPLVLVAPSTSQDPDQRLLHCALEAARDQPVRVLATTNGRPVRAGLELPPNARITRWLSHARAMRECALVICHGGHGTVARALCAGRPVLVCPEAGDMAENAARVAWAGAGLSVPRRLRSARGIRLALRRMLADESYAATARELSLWALRHEPRKQAAIALERFVAAGTPRASKAPRVGLEPTT